MQMDSQVQCFDNEDCHKSKTQTLSVSSKMEPKVLKKRNRTSQKNARHTGIWFSGGMKINKQEPSREELKEGDSTMMYFRVNSKKASPILHTGYLLSKTFQ